MIASENAGLRGYVVGLSIVAVLGAPVLAASSLLGHDPLGSLGLGAIETRLMRLLLVWTLICGIGYLERDEELQGLSWVRSVVVVVAYFGCALTVSCIWSGTEFGDRKEWVAFFFMPSLLLMSVLGLLAAAILKRRIGFSNGSGGRSVKGALAGWMLACAPFCYIGMRAVGVESLSRVIVPLSLGSLGAALFLSRVFSQNRPPGRVPAVLFGTIGAVFATALGLL